MKHRFVLIFQLWETSKWQMFRMPLLLCWIITNPVSDNNFLLNLFSADIQVNMKLIEFFLSMYSTWKTFPGISKEQKIRLYMKRLDFEAITIIADLVWSPFTIYLVVFDGLNLIFPNKPNGISDICVSRLKFVEIWWEQTTNTLNMVSHFFHNREKGREKL